VDPVRRSLVAAGALGALGFAGVTRAQPVAGRNYTVHDPALQVESGERIEIVEFFWYGCIYCYNLEPALEAWAKTLPADVAVRRIPAVFNQRWAHDALIFYALEAIGVVERLHWPLFQAIHVNRLNTVNERAFSEWLRAQGVDDKAFGEAYRSEPVREKLRRAAQLTSGYRIDGTPSLAVHGRFTISADQGGSARGMFSTAEHLIAEVRKAGGAAAK